MYSDQAKETSLPKRVIDVVGKPHLLVTKGECGQYAALSYCWGHPQHDILMLTSSRLRDLQSEIPMEQLPKTIRDAISVTKDLGFRYLWVDRLCIIQDNRHDWEDQAAQMCDIYERATLTFAALGESDNSGLFPANDEMPLRLNCGAADDGLGMMHVAMPEYSNPGSATTLDDELKESRWAHRGWTLQERLLSRRVVYFGERLSWECHEMAHPPHKSKWMARWQQDRAATYGTKLEILRDIEGSRRELLLHTQLLNQNQMSVWRFLWQRIVENYTNRGLSQDSDRATALAGLVQVLQSRLPRVDYFFGHWIDIIWAGPGGLLWVLEQQSESAMRLTPQLGTCAHHLVPALANPAAVH